MRSNTLWIRPALNNNRSSETEPGEERRREEDEAGQASCEPWTTLNRV